MTFGTALQSYRPTPIAVRSQVLLVLARKRENRAHEATVALNHFHIKATAPSSLAGGNQRPVSLEERTGYRQDM